MELSFDFVVYEEEEEETSLIYGIFSWTARTTRLRREATAAIADVVHNLV